LRAVSRWVCFFDLAGSYNPALIGAAVALIGAVALVSRLGAYAYPVRSARSGWSWRRNRR